MKPIARLSCKSERTAEPDAVLPSATLTEVDDEEKQYKRKSFFALFGRLVYEQRTHWFYSMVITGALGASIMYPLQA
jgi:hypothetical protein